MRLISLQISNIRSHEMTRIDFPAGSILFHGDMGSGKSTILMATEFALFGLGNMRADALLTRGRQRGEVVLQFETNGKIYEVGRTLISSGGQIKQDPKNTFVKEDDVTLPLTPTDLKSYIMDKLKFREPANPRAASRVFRYAIYTPQEEIKAILYGGTDREDTIRRAFGMDDYKIAMANASIVISYLKKSADRLEGKFDRLEEYKSDLQHNTNILKDIDSELQSIDSHEYDISKEHENLKHETDRLRQNLDQLNMLEESRGQKKDALGKLVKMSRNLQEWIAQGERDLHDTGRIIRECKAVPKPTEMSLSDVNSRLKSVQDLRQTIHTTKDRLAGRRKEAEMVRLSLDGLDTDAIDTRIVQQKENIADLVRRQKDAEESVGKKITEQGGLRNEIDTLKKALSRAESLGAICEYCEQPIKGGYVKKLLCERQDKLAGAEASMAFVRTTLNKAQAAAQSFRDQVKSGRDVLYGLESRQQDARKLARLMQEMAAMESTMHNLESRSIMEPHMAFPKLDGEEDPDYLMRLRDALIKYYDVDKRRAQYEEQRSDIISRLEGYGKQQESDRGQIKILQDELSGISEQLSGRPSLVEHHDATKIQRDAAAAKLTDIQNRSAAMRERRTNTTKEISRLEDEIKSAHNYRSIHSEYKDHIEWLSSYFVHSLLVIEREVLKDILLAFDEYYREWYTMLVDDPTKTSSIDDRFGPILEQGGYEQPLDNLSGGEKTCVALAYRLALNSTIRDKMKVLDSNLLILDEPTDGFSREQMTKVRMVLKSLAAEQVIMVSHEAELEGFVNHVFRVSKNGGISIVEKI